MITVILLLSAALARADVPNQFDSSKMSTESLALGVNTCAGRFEESRKDFDKRKDLITRHYCACMMDATQAQLSKTNAKKCLTHAKQVVDSYLTHQTVEKERNLFDPKILPTSDLYTMLLVCLKKQGQNSVHRCGCEIDAVRTDPDFTAEDYVSDKKPLKPEWIRACGNRN